MVKDEMDKTDSFSLTDGLVLDLFIFSANSRLFWRISSSSNTLVLIISTGLTTSGTLTDGKKSLTYYL